MQARYQYGNLTLRKRKKGPDVWQFRWMENGRPKSVLIGTIEKLPTQVDAERAVEYRRIQINALNPQREFHSITVGALADRFMEEYAPKHCRRPTQRVYRSFLDTHIRPRWGSVPIRSVKTMPVEDWLDGYNEREAEGKDGKKISKPVSRQIKSHVRNLMHTLFQAAIRWEMLERNPIDLVTQSRRRLKTPRVLTPAEFKALLAQLTEPYKTMVLMAACLGLRVSELLGLQWGDIDFEKLTVKIQRSFVEGEIYPTKNEASEGTLPLDPYLAEALLKHRAQAVCPMRTGYVFAGAMGRPRWPDALLADHIKPAAMKAGIGNIGWHTFRHTYSTLLHALGTKPAVQKELLRHADIETTLNIYTQAMTPDKREAASRVVSALWKM